MVDYNKISENLRAGASKLKYNPVKMRKIVESAQEKAKKNSTFLAQYANDFKTLLRMLGAFVSGRYKKIPWSSVAYACMGLVYFVNPLDAIPDFIIGPGLLDDATVMALVLRALNKDLKKFRNWESQLQPFRRG